MVGLGAPGAPPEAAAPGIDVLVAPPPPLLPPWSSMEAAIARARASSSSCRAASKVLKKFIPFQTVRCIRWSLKTVRCQKTARKNTLTTESCSQVVPKPESLSSTLQAAHVRPTLCVRMRACAHAWEARGRMHHLLLCPGAIAAASPAAGRLFVAPPRSAPDHAAAPRRSSRPRGASRCCADAHAGAAQCKFLWQAEASSVVREPSGQQPQAGETFMWVKGQCNRQGKPSCG